MWNSNPAYSQTLDKAHSNKYAHGSCFVMFYHDLILVSFTHPLQGFITGNSLSALEWTLKNIVSFNHMDANKYIDGLMRERHNSIALTHRHDINKKA